MLQVCRMWLLALLGGVLIIGPTGATEEGRKGTTNDYEDYQEDSEELYTSVEDYEDKDYNDKSGLVNCTSFLLSFTYICFLNILFEVE